MNDKCKYLVEKSNIFNTFRFDENSVFTLTELRIFCLYLAHLNPKDKEKRDVCISFKEFQEVYGVKLRYQRLSVELQKMLKRTVIIQEEGCDQPTYIQLYSKFRLSDSKDSVLLSANFDLFPYIFELSQKYTKYVLHNIVSLNSVAKIRLYEILIQNNYLGEKSINIEDLKSMLGSNCTQFKDFNKNILVPAVKDINEYTNLNVSFVKIRNGHSVSEIKFIINEKDIGNVPNTPPLISDNTVELYDEYFKIRGISISDAEKIINKLEKLNVYISLSLEIVLEAYDKQKETKNIKQPLNYIMKIINNKVKNEELKKKQETSYDINEFDKYAINYSKINKIKDI